MAEPVERKFVVFISSTKRDLSEHRARVIEAVIDLGHIPSAMEHFRGAKTVVSYIEKKVMECDIFILLSGYRSGMKAGSLTYVQREYEAAKRYKKEIRFFLLEDQDFEEHNPDASLRRFREEIMKAGRVTAPLVQRFSLDDPDKTAAKVKDTLLEITAEMQRAETGGWIRAEHYDKIKDHPSLGEAGASPFYRRYIDFFRSFHTLNERSLTRHQEKQAIGEYIWERFLTEFDSAGVRAIYFESGSSTAYVSYELLAYVRRNSEQYITLKLRNELTIVTNNFLTLMDFTVYQGMMRPMADIVLYPKGQVRDKYGVTYGPLAEAGLYAQTDEFKEKGWTLDARAAAPCRTVTEAIDQHLGKKGVIMMAVSGIDWNRTEHYYGPHVGSYPNMLMKRCLLESKHPKIIVLDDAKWRNNYVPETCFPICGDDKLNWSEILRSKPIAFAIGVRGAKPASAIRKELEELQFRTTAKPPQDGIVSVIGINDAFSRWLKSPVS